MDRLDETGQGGAQQSRRALEWQAWAVTGLPAMLKDDIRWPCCGCKAKASGEGCNRHFNRLENLIPLSMRDHTTLTGMHATNV